MTTDSPPGGSPIDVPGRSAPGSRRWRVMVVRIPPGRLEDVRAVLPGGRKVSPEDLPFIARTTAEQLVAEQTAERLRRAGACVLLLEEPTVNGAGAFCGFHPDRIAARTCAFCGTAICTSCFKHANAEDVCPDCMRRGRGRKRSTRLRQLFVMFLFAVFCYEVFRFFDDQAEAVDASGVVRVAVLQFAPPGEPLPPVARDLNANPGQGTSFRDIGPWLTGERARYGGPGRYEVTVFGPWSREVTPPPLPDPDTGPLRAAWMAWKYPRYFHGIALDQGIDVRDFGARLYVVYTDRRGDQASESRGSSKGRVAIAFVSAQERNPGYAVLTVAHELGHVLGADDLYDPVTYRSQHPEGFVEPFATHLYPQRYAELMSVDRPTGPRSEEEVVSLEQVRIGHRTAASMGWITHQQADLFYSPPQQLPEDRLSPAPATAP